jgi:hypothetical protein
VFGAWQPTPIVPLGVSVVAGTGLLIFAGQSQRGFLFSCLQYRPAVYLGLISYSLYLWHWPILVFTKYYLVRPPQAVELFAALLAMLFAATASWHFIERPFRDRRMPIVIVRYAAAASGILLSVLAATLLWKGGLPSRLDKQAATINQAVGTIYRCPLSDYVILGELRACVMHLPSRNPADADIVLLGNSHAQMYAPLWRSIVSAKQMTGLLVPVNACLPTVTINVTSECITIAKRNLSQILRLPRAKIVILGLTWWNESTGLVDDTARTYDARDNKQLIDALDDLIMRLHKNGKQVLLIGPLAQPGREIASEVSRDIAFGRKDLGPLSIPTVNFLTRFDDVIHHFDSRTDVILARPDLAQCDSTACFYLVDGHSLFADDNHVAVSELGRFSQVFTASLTKLLQLKSPTQ